ncbi:MAG: ATP-binding protein [Ktedonobacteraceae bacterium]
MTQRDFDIPENGSSAQIPYNGKQSIAEQKARLEAEEQTIDVNGDEQQYKDAIAFVHFDAPSTKSNMVEALVHYDDLGQIERGKYVRIFCKRDRKEYTGRILEGPFFDPDALKRDSTPVQFIIMNQGGKKPFIPEYHGRIVVEILGEERGGILLGAVRRPHPGSPIIPFQQAMMEKLLHLEGKICLGYLDNYEDTLVRIRENDKGVIPRNWLTVGTIGSGKSNTNQVFIEETLAAGFAQIVLDPEGEYIFMDQPTDSKSALDDLPQFARIPQGVKNLTVYRPPLATSKRQNAVEFSVPFDALNAELIVELTDMTPAQQVRFPLLYEQAIQYLIKETGNSRALKQDDLDISRGFPGIKLQRLITMLKEVIDYSAHKSDNHIVSSGGKKNKGSLATEIVGTNSEEGSQDHERHCYFHLYQLQPLIQNYQDLVSYRALYYKLLGLQRTRLFDRDDAPPLNARSLCLPGKLAVIDLSDCASQQVANIIIADLLIRIYRYKMKLSEGQNEQRKVIITIEEAHGFVSRERQDKMLQTLDQLRRIARRGRKRWLCLHLVTQSPQHLPAELFELVNNKIIHQMTGAENLRVLKAAAGMVNEAIWDDVPSLGRGRAVIVCQSQYPHPIIVRIRPAASRRYYQN